MALHYAHTQQLICTSCARLISPPRAQLFSVPRAGGTALGPIRDKGTGRCLTVLDCKLPMDGWAHRGGLLAPPVRSPPGLALVSAVPRGALPHAPCITGGIYFEVHVARRCICWALRAHHTVSAAAPCRPWPPTTWPSLSWTSAAARPARAAPPAAGGGAIRAPPIAFCTDNHE